MQYENYKEAVSLVNQINNHKEILRELQGDNMTVSINRGFNPIICLEAISESDEYCNQVCEVFINTVKDYYQNKIAELNQKLLAL